MIGSDHDEWARWRVQDDESWRAENDEWERWRAARDAKRDRGRLFWRLFIVVSAAAAVSLFFVITSALGADLIDLSIPDPAITPGVVAVTSVDQVCHTKWGKDRRHVTKGMGREVFARYGLTGNTDKACIRDKHGRRCEIDHLISRELGGADHLDNLWPQPYGSKPWNAVMKDRLENRLHLDVCSGIISLEHAQNEIRLDWRIPYRRYFGEPR